jgi:hypothetical protein
VDVVVGTDDGARRFHEEWGLGRNWHIGLGGMIAIVQSDTDDLADVANARAKARVSVNEWQSTCIQRVQHMERCATQCRSSYILDLSAEIS